ncbi:nSTAND1 domain-containing NTPase, partial [Streptomyces sp. NPDC001732]
MARFETADQERFFGRERLTARLAELVADHRLVLLVGPSGSGKSSLLRAGLVPRLHRPGAGERSPSAIRILAPGPRPAFTHAHLDGAPPGVLIVVDQFEEVFTLCTDSSERDRFVDLLLDIVRSEHGGRVVLAVRSDFYGHLAQYGPLSEAAQGATLLVGPMTPEELREAVVRPAALDGLIVERALTARVLRDVADEPGGLPLISHALLETGWGGLLFLPDGRSLLVSDELGRDSAVTRSWDLRRGTMTTRPLGAEGRMTSSPDGKLLVTSAGLVYRLPSGDLLPYTGSSQDACETHIEMIMEREPLALGCGVGGERD